MLLSIDATFIFVFISFAVFIFLMKLICFAPITKVIEEREKFYLKNKNTANETNAKKDALIKEAENEINSAKSESSNLIIKAAEENKIKKEEIILNKKNEILNSTLELEKNLNDSSKDAKYKLKSELENYVKSTVSKVLEIDYNSVNVDKTKIDEIIK